MGQQKPYTINVTPELGALKGSPTTVTIFLHYGARCISESLALEKNTPPEKIKTLIKNSIENLEKKYKEGLADFSKINEALAELRQEGIF